MVEIKAHLDNVVSTVLNNNKLFQILSSILPKGQGLELGAEMSYWSDIRVNVHYGLTIKNEKLSLFFYEEADGEKFRLEFRDTFKTQPPSFTVSATKDYQNIPSGEKFFNNLTRSLEHYQLRTVEFKPEDQNIF